MASSMKPNIADQSANQRGSENGRSKNFTCRASILEARNFSRRESAISWKDTSVIPEDLMSAIPQIVPVRTPEPIAPGPAHATPKSKGPWKLIILLAVLAIGGYLAYRLLSKPQAPAAETAVVV